MPRIDRVWYELELKANEFQRGLDNAEKSASRFSNFIAKHPIAVAGALAAALVTVGVRATQMAGELDSSLKKVDVKLRATQAEARALRDGVLDMTKASGRGMAELAGALDAIATGGAENAAAALERLRVATAVADTTGADLTMIVSGLDLVLDAFGLSTQDAEATLAKLYTTAKGKVPLDELLAVLGKSALSLNTLGVSLDQTLVGITALVDAGVPAKAAASGFVEIIAQFSSASTAQRKAAAALGVDLSATAVQSKGVAGVFKDLADKTGLSATALASMGFSTQQLQVIQVLGQRANKEFAQSTIDAGAAIRQLNADAIEVRDSQAVLAKRLRAELDAALMEFGTVTLPLVTKSLRNVVDLIQILNGTVAAIHADAAITTITVLSGAIGKLTDDKQLAALDRLRRAMQFLVGGGGVGAVVSPGVIAKMSNEQLTALRDGLTAMVATAKLTAAELAIAQRNLSMASLTLDLRGAAKPTGAATTTGGGTTTGTPKPPPAPLDPAIVKQRAEMLKAAADAAVAATVSMVDDIELQLTRLEAAAHETFGKRLPAAIVAQLQALRDKVASIRATEPLEQEFAALAEKGDGIAQLGAIDDVIARTQAQLTLAKDGTEEQKRLVDLLKKEKDLRDKIVLNAADARSGNASTAAEVKSQQEINAALRERARTLREAAQGAIQLADAFGLVDARAAAALENMVQVAAAIPGAIAGDASSILSLAGGVAKLFGGGKDPERQRFLEQQKRNTEAIEQLTRTVGDFGKNITGQQFAGVSQAVSATVAAIGALRPAERMGALGVRGFAENTITAQLRALGLSMEDLRKAASELGITLDESNGFTFAASLEKLNEALKQTELTRFAQAFSGQLDALRAEFQLFDITDPIAQLARLREVLTDPKFGAPALRAALAGLDLSSPEGRAQAQKAVQALFTQLQAGTLSASQLGGLTPEQFLQALLDVKGLLSQSGGATGQTSQFTVDRSITEVTGSRLAGLLTSGNAWLQEIEAHTRIAADLLARMIVPVTGIQPPPLSALAGMSANIVIGPVTINVSAAGMTPEAARGVGMEIGDAMVAQINTALGRSLRTQKLLTGDVRRAT